MNAFDSPSAKAPTASRVLSPAQQRVLPLTPIFAACKKRGLVCTNENRDVRLYAVNRFFNSRPFDWIEESFKELCDNPAAITAVARAIESGALFW